MVAELLLLPPVVRTYLQLHGGPDLHEQACERHPLRPLLHDGIHRGVQRQHGQRVGSQQPQERTERA